jgi:hypothetical protein
VPPETKPAGTRRSAAKKRAWNSPPLTPLRINKSPLFPHHHAAAAWQRPVYSAKYAASRCIAVTAAQARMV